MLEENNSQATKFQYIDILQISWYKLYIYFTKNVSIRLNN